MRFMVVLAALLAGLVPAAVRAEWREASSEHFVVYADDSEREIRKFSEQLERYHSALKLLTSTKLEVPSPSNRVTVYVVRNEAAVRELYGANSRYVGGFYIPSAGGSLAIVPQVTTGTRELEFSMTTLLHEYAHHYMRSVSAFPMPRWYSEGGAEFFSAATFPAKGGVTIGRPAQHRAAELFMTEGVRSVKLAELLDPPAQAKRKGYDDFYGRSWALFHYLTFDKSRQGQLNRYLQLLAEGKSSREAGLAAFGDLAKLDGELDAYLMKPSLLSFNLKPELVPSGPVTIRQLRPGEAAMMPVRMRSKRGVNEKSAPAVLAEARAVAARYPDDPAVLSALAEAEYDAGNDKEAIVAADAAIAKDPSQVNAHVHKGLSLFRMAATAPDKAAAYKSVRNAFVALNRREPDHPLPLIYYYRSFIAQGVPPPKLALEGLAQASALAPFDLGLRMTLAMEQIRHGQLGAARQNLAPIAFDPHGQKLAEAARLVIAKLDADPKWDGHDLAEIVGRTEAGNDDE